MDDKCSKELEDAKFSMLSILIHGQPIGKVIEHLANYCETGKYWHAQVTTRKKPRLAVEVIRNSKQKEHYGKTVLMIYELPDTKDAPVIWDLCISENGMTAHEFDDGAS